MFIYHPWLGIGVRLEDVVLVTATGAENLTFCPRTVEEVEGVLHGAPWPPVRDDAKVLRRRMGFELAPDGMGMIEVKQL